MYIHALRWTRTSTVFGVSVCTRCTCVSHTSPRAVLSSLDEQATVQDVLQVQVMNRSHSARHTATILAEYRYYFLCTSFEHRSDPYLQCSFEKNIGNLRTAPKLVVALALRFFAVNAASCVCSYAYVHARFYPCLVDVR